MPQPVKTFESAIHFYAGVKLDPKEERLYIPRPPSGFDYANGKISDYWTREAFENECLNPYEVSELLIDPSYYQSVGKQIQHFAPVSSFQLKNVNFVKVINADEDGEKIYYGFISSVTYDNDYVTNVDWAVSEFYTNVFNGLKFNDANISQAHNVLTDVSTGVMINDDQFRLKESLSAGDVLIPKTAGSLMPKRVKDGGKTNAEDIRFFVTEYYAADASKLSGGDGVGIGYPSQRAYIVIPFNRYNGQGVDIVDSTGQKITSTYHGQSVSKILSDIGGDGAISGDQFSVGTSAVTYGLGGDYDYDEAAGTVTFTIPNLEPGAVKFFKFGKQLGGQDIGIMYRSGYGKGIEKKISDSLYDYMLKALEGISYGKRLKDYFEARGGIPEKLTHYIGVNVLDGDAMAGYFTIDEVSGDPNSEFKSSIMTSPHNASRVDILIQPYTNMDILGFQIARKMTNQRASSIPFVEDSWASYSFLNQNQMQNAQNVISTTQNITESQNKFNNDQAHLSAAQRTDAQGVANAQNMAMTTQTANQQLGMSYAQNGVGVAKGALQGTIGNSSSLLGAIGGGLGGGTGAAANGAADIAFQTLSRQNTLQNQSLSNAQASQMTALGNQQSLQLADNTLSFGNKIAARTAQMQLASLHAGWNDMKLQPATVLSGGSSSEYLAQMDWDYISFYLSYPTEATMMAIGRYLMQFGNTVNIFDTPQKYMFTRKVVNFIKTDDCSIAPSSNIENSTRLMLEAGFNRGFQIWHDLNKMAANDYRGNDYA